jgi:hypothetical protein
MCRSGGGTSHTRGLACSARWSAERLASFFSAQAAANRRVLRRGHTKLSAGNSMHTTNTKRNTTKPTNSHVHQSVRKRRFWLHWPAGQLPHLLLLLLLILFCTIIIDNNGTK